MSHSIIFPSLYTNKGIAIKLPTALWQIVQRNINSQYLDYLVTKKKYLSPI